MTSQPRDQPAVLILAYNRVDELRQVLQAVVEQGPARIYVSVDGPKAASVEDVARVAAVREATRAMQETYPIQTRFAETNGGVLEGVLEGIDWFFSQENQGIVLEDDVVIAPDSLAFAWSLLEELQPNRRIGSISLFNPVPRSRLSQPDTSVRLSALPSSQFWASWSDRWSATRPLRSHSPVEQTQVMGALASIPDPRLRRFWLDHLTNSGEDWQCWEDLWILTHWTHGWSAAYTNGNFSRHIGFSRDATNSWDQPSWYPTQYDEIKPYSSAGAVPEPDASADAWYFNQRFGLGNWKRIKHAVWSRMPWLRAFYLSTKRQLVHTR